jgi:hypothetical protein
MACGKQGNMINAYKILVSKSERKMSLRISMHRWEDNIKMDVREIGYEVWTGFIWLRTGANAGLV